MLLVYISPTSPLQTLHKLTELISRLQSLLAAQIYSQPSSAHMHHRWKKQQNSKTYAAAEGQKERIRC